jgi:hypothetical protein
MPVALRQTGIIYVWKVAARQTGQIEQQRDALTGLLAPVNDKTPQPSRLPEPLTWPSKDLRPIDYCIAFQVDGISSAHFSKAPVHDVGTMTRA